MKKAFENAMIASSKKMGTETVEETAYCFPAFAGVVTSIAFTVYGLAFFPMM